VKDIEYIHICIDTTFFELTESNLLQTYKYYVWINDTVENEYDPSIKLFENIPLGKDDLIILCSIYTLSLPTLQLDQRSISCDRF